MESLLASTDRGALDHRLLDEDRRTGAQGQGDRVRGTRVDDHARPVRRGGG